jgi:hypothetical protein
MLNGAWVRPQAAVHAEFFGPLRERLHRRDSLRAPAEEAAAEDAGGAEGDSAPES